ncbi:MAG: SWIM zinc finger family protein, partial [Desulfatitalea sp.]
AVLDLQIKPGQIEALVQGSREKPYEVHINIDKLSPTTWRHIRGTCEGRIDSLQTLLAGAFPKELGDLFMNQERGLFPSPKEIHFECSCPDWAGMCKHVAAVLYGVGARLDEEPALLFVLREGTVDDLISKAVAAATRKLLDQADAESNGARVIADADLSSLFGIDLEGPGAPAERPKAVPAKKRRAQKPESLAQVVKKKTKSDVPATPAAPKRRRIAVCAVPEALPPAEPPKSAKKKKKQQPEAKRAASSPAEKIVAIIRQSVQGVDTAMLQQRTGLEVAKIRTIIYAALRKGQIRRVGWGVYKGA